MQKAIIMAQICLYVAVLLPFFSDRILQLRGVAVGITGWLLALLGPVGCLVLCEACKLITAFQVQNYQAALAKRHDEEDKRLEAAARAHQEATLGAGGAQKKAVSFGAPKKAGSSKAALASGGFDGAIVPEARKEAGKVRGKFATRSASCFGRGPKLQFVCGVGFEQQG
mmetsp:Transcript_23351/g.66471  ORF Transcript_23351/g.66471 Transcript_23351/m.66471 type:complete len:169 (+) Transcript_23351:2-508(+)